MMGKNTKSKMNMGIYMFWERRTRVQLSLRRKMRENRSKMQFGEESGWKTERGADVARRHRRSGWPRGACPRQHWNVRARASLVQGACALARLAARSEAWVLGRASPSRLVLSRSPSSELRFDFRFRLRISLESSYVIQFLFMSNLLLLPVKIRNTKPGSKKSTVGLL